MIRLYTSVLILLYTLYIEAQLTMMEIMYHYTNGNQYQITNKHGKLSSAIPRYAIIPHQNPADVCRIDQMHLKNREYQLFRKPY